MRNHSIIFGRLVFVHLQTYVSFSAFSFHSVYPDVLPSPPLPSPTLLILVHVSKEIRWPRRAAHINKIKGVFRVLVGKHEGKATW